MPALLSKVFNWKKHPAGVFVLALPLALIGFFSLALKAWLHWKLQGDAVYALMLAVGLLVLAVALIPAWRMHQTSQRLASLARHN